MVNPFSPNLTASSNPSMKFVPF